MQLGSSKSPLPASTDSILDSRGVVSDSILIIFVIIIDDFTFLPSHMGVLEILVQHNVAGRFCLFTHHYLRIPHSPIYPHIVERVIIFRISLFFIIFFKLIIWMDFCSTSNLEANYQQRN